MNQSPTLLLALTLLIGSCTPHKEHALYRMAHDERGTTYSFSKQGPTFHVPTGWSTADPKPKERARLLRDESDGALGRCWFNVFIDDRYHGLSGEQILKKFHDPQAFHEMADTASLAAFDHLTIHGLPAVRSSWASLGTHRGIQVPIRTRLRSIAYKGAVISSTCVATQFDSKLLAAEFDDIQLSFRLPAKH